MGPWNEHRHGAAAGVGGGVLLGSYTWAIPASLGEVFNYSAQGSANGDTTVLTPLNGPQPFTIGADAPFAVVVR